MLSFMRNSKVWLLIKVIIFFLLFVVMVESLNFFVFPRKSDSKRTIDEFYTHKDLNVVFLGTSSTFRSNIPLIVDEVAGVKSYNLATAAQSFMSSYYLLKESVKYNKVRTVILHMNISRFQTSYIDNSWQFQVIENMKFSLEKLKFLFSGFSIEKFPEAMLKCYRAREYLRSESIAKNLSYDDMAKLKNIPAKVIPYLGKGYLFADKKQVPGEINVGSFDIFDEEKIKLENTEYLNKIISLCKERNVDLIFLARPRLAANIMAGGNYGDFHNYVQKLADENNVPFWDLTYLRPEVLKIDDTMFMDGYHANYTLALPLSRLLGKMLNEHNKGTLDISKYLFDSYKEYLKTNNRIAGLYTSKLSKDRIIKACAAAGEGVETEFRFLLASNKDGNYKVVQDWSAKDKIDLSKQGKKKCWLMVEARRIGTDDEAEQRTRIEINLR